MHLWMRLRKTQTVNRYYRLDLRKIALARRGAEDSALARRGEHNNASVYFAKSNSGILIKRRTYAKLRWLGVEPKTVR